MWKRLVFSLPSCWLGFRRFRSICSIIMCPWVPTVWIQLIGKLAKENDAPRQLGRDDSSCWRPLLLDTTQVASCMICPLASGLTESWRKTVVTQMATPLVFHDLFSHQVLAGEITSCPLLLHELRVVRDMRYLENEGTKIWSSEAVCLSRRKNWRLQQVGVPQSLAHRTEPWPGFLFACHTGHSPLNTLLFLRRPL